MALKALVDSIDEVAEGLRGEYEEVADGEHTGRFRLKVDGADSLVDVSGLKGALNKERQKSKLADSIRKEFPNATDDEIAELLKKAKGIKNGQGEPEKDPEKLVLKLRKELDEEYTPIKQERDDARAELRKFKLNERARTAAVKAGMLPDEVDEQVELLVVRKRLDLNDKGDVVVLDKEGDPSSVSLEKFFSDVYKKEKPRVYKAPDAAGGDTGDRRRAPNATPASELELLNKLPPAARLTEARKRGIGTSKS